MPDAFEPSTSWDDCIKHFDSATRVNEWDAPTYSLWLEVQMLDKPMNISKIFITM